MIIQIFKRLHKFNLLPALFLLKKRIVFSLSTVYCLLSTVFFCLLLTAYCLLPTAYYLVPTASADSTWNTNLPNTILEARKWDKFLLLYFYVDNDKSSQKMEEKTLLDINVQSMYVPFYLVRINSNSETELVRKYNITSYPTVVFTRPQGNEIGRVVGYVSAKKFQKKIQEVAAKNLTYYSIETLQSQLRNKPKDVSVLYSFAVEQMNLRDYQYAAKVFRQILELDAIDEFGYGDVSRLNLAYCLLQGKPSQDNNEAAIRYLEELLQKYPQTEYKPEINYLLGITYKSLGKNIQAIECFLQSSSPDSPEFWASKAKKQLQQLTPP